MVRWTAITILTMFLIFGNYSFLDLKEAIIYYGKAITPTYPLLGGWIFILIIIFVIFSKEIIYYFNIARGKIKLRESF